MERFDKYKVNLKQVGDDIYSYGTKVATIHQDKLIQHGYWSMTTQKHINYVAKELGLEIDKNYE